MVDGKDQGWAIGLSAAYSTFGFGTTVKVQLAESGHGSVLTGFVNPSLDLWLTGLFLPVCARLGVVGGAGIDWHDQSTLLAGLSAAVLVADENSWFEIYYKPAMRFEGGEIRHEFGVALGWTTADF